ncbi:MAG: hypothetical protein V2A56_09535 [bacterium]
MNTGQMLLTLGALMLISLVILNFNRNLADIDDSLNYDRFRLEALSLLTSHIEEVSEYFFDEVSTDTSTEKSLNNFTTPNSLGYDADDGGVVDDIDDFNGQVIPDTGRSGAIYNLQYTVQYVKVVSNQIQTSATREYNKRVTIKIWDAFDPPLIGRMVNGVVVNDTLQLSTVISYWFFN